jgi:carbonic anhydrase/acetyltransferase-like protein (isoleucine patch superfamily)
VLGSPAKVIRAINQKERDAIEYGAAHYVELGRQYLAGDIESSVR